MLLEHDADVDAVDADSRTLLMLASSNGMAGMVSQLVRALIHIVCQGLGAKGLVPGAWCLVLSGQCCRSISCCCLVLIRI